MDFTMLVLFWRVIYVGFFSAVIISPFSNGHFFCSSDSLFSMNMSFFNGHFFSPPWGIIKLASHAHWLPRSRITLKNLGNPSNLTQTTFPAECFSSNLWHHKKCIRLEIKFRKFLSIPFRKYMHCIVHLLSCSWEKIISVKKAEILN